MDEKQNDPETVDELQPKHALREDDFDQEDVAESHDEDVDSALERETQDGKGGAVVPKADFESYATDEVEEKDEKES